jgi:hypothetical protein
MFAIKEWCVFLTKKNRNDRRGLLSTSGHYFYTVGGQILGPVTSNELLSLYKKQKVTEQTLVIRDNGNRWLELGKTFPDLASQSTSSPPQMEPNALFTMNKTGPVQVLPLQIKKRTPNALFLEEYSKMPDGTQRKLLIPGKDEIPSTPELALQQYIRSQKLHIQTLKRLLEKEEKKLEQAQDLLKGAVANKKLAEP